MVTVINYKPTFRNINIKYKLTLTDFKIYRNNLLEMILILLTQLLKILIIIKWYREEILFNKLVFKKYKL
jgi:hypothetical protein